MMSKLRGILLALAVSCARGHVAYWNTQNQLHPVQGLYVKPSVDGTTGDLYVAASEDSGMKTQWLTDKPVNFLPTAGAQHAAVPYTYTPSHATPLEDMGNPHKRAVVTNPTFQFAYAFPGVSGDSGAVPYPYTVATPNLPANPTEISKDCADTPKPTYAQYSPYQYYYPQMMTAFTNAVNALKEAGLSEDDVNSVMTQAAAPLWPPSYAYPIQYVMVDPAKWAQSQTAAAAVAPSTVATPTSSANSEAESDESS